MVWCLAEALLQSRPLPHIPDLPDGGGSGSGDGAAHLHGVPPAPQPIDSANRQVLRFQGRDSPSESRFKKTTYIKHFICVTIPWRTNN